ncbi:MAG: hypothetical protein LAT84_08035 [Balneolia bacterium]|nr:hypothetical protein [Balneolia bacterium]
MSLASYTFELYYLLLAVLVFFSVASFVLAAVTISNAFRLRNVLLAWRTGRFGGFPLFATMFLGLSVILGGMAWYFGMSNYYPVTGAYMFLSLNWVISSYFMSKRYITDHGIMKNINDPSQTVAWRNIDDFVEQPGNQGNSYAFIYKKKTGENGTLNYHRLEIEVPAQKVEGFRKVLNHKLGRRFQHTFSDVHSFGAINIDIDNAE